MKVGLWGEMVRANSFASQKETAASIIFQIPWQRLKLETMSRRDIKFSDAA
jgi:hypothetical protein